jgi:hypothetical protein
LLLGERPLRLIRTFDIASTWYENRRCLVSEPKMVFGIVALATTVPLLATSTVNFQEGGKSHGNQESNRSTTGDECAGNALGWKTQTCHLIVKCTERMNEARRNALNGCRIVLRDGCLYLTGANTRDQSGHPFTGHSLPFPKTDYLGLVSTISQEPPKLNWIYIDRETYELKYGVRKVAQTQLTGPFDYKIGVMSVTITASTGRVEKYEEGEKRIKFNNREGFVAVEEEDGVWKLYFDVDNDGLRRVKAGNSGKRMAEINVIRALAEKEEEEEQ